MCNRLLGLTSILMMDSTSNPKRWFYLKRVQGKHPKKTYKHCKQPWNPQKFVIIFDYYTYRVQPVSFVYGCGYPPRHIACTACMLLWSHSLTLYSHASPLGILSNINNMIIKLNSTCTCIKIVISRLYTDYKHYAMCGGPYYWRIRANYIFNWFSRWRLSTTTEFRGCAVGVLQVK
jgi:hypothetical protein